MQMPKLNDPWLLAVWPGMGRVARTAGEYLAARLGMQHIDDFPVDRYFELNHVTVDQGVARAGPRPHCPVYLWTDPDQRHDLVLLLGEAQPERGGYELCQEVIAEAKTWHVSRVIAFAAMATQMHPSRTARTFGAVTHAHMMDELHRLNVEPLTGSQIGGLNGLMLAAAQQDGLEGVCLLGELPYFAAQLPNPKASRVVLGVLTEMMGIELDFAELDQKAEQIDARLVDLVETLQQRAEQEGELAEELDEGESFLAGGEPEEPPAARPKLDPRARQRIEKLFEEARRDRSKAFQLKRELDQHQVFKEYEDRFLDLFKRGE